MRRYQMVFFIGFLCFIAGCLPEVGWLPDSSGFVFTSGENLLAYDLTTKKQRVILQNAAAGTTFSPAVSPDGKRVALAYVQGEPKRQSMVIQFVICDLKGNVEFRSESLTLAKDLDWVNEERKPTCKLVWSPNAKQLLVHVRCTDGRGTPLLTTSSLFHLQTKKIETWNGWAPLCGGFSQRPDGAGFLLFDDQQKLAWVEWSGKKGTIVGPVPTNLDFAPLLLVDSHWNGSKAVVTLYSNEPRRWNERSRMIRSVIDTQKLWATLDDVPADDVMLGAELIRKRLTLASGVEIYVLSKDPAASTEKEVEKSEFRVVALKKGELALNELFRGSGCRIFLLSPSPDRSRAMLVADQCYIINEAGQIHDKFAHPLPGR